MRFGELDHTYYIVELNYTMPPDVLDWLKEKYGPPGDRWWTTLKRVYFANQHDHLMFTLRWA